jgi:molybdopterin-guanine dinucleotide biosynthesis protein
VIKHTREFELDKQGKDSWQFIQAGADTAEIMVARELSVTIILNNAIG